MEPNRKIEPVLPTAAADGPPVIDAVAGAAPPAGADAPPAAAGKPSSAAGFSLRYKWPLMVLFLLLAAASIWAVVSQSRDFSLAEFLAFVKKASPGWLLAGALGMLGFIFFEGEAVLCLCRAFGFPRSHRRGFVYSASDVYFSAITPSASGGQPASAFFMLKDGIPTSVSTVVLIANLEMYSLAILTITLIMTALYYPVIHAFSPFSKLLIIAGTVIQVVLVVLLVLLLTRERWVLAIVRFLTRLGHRLHIVRDLERSFLRAEKWAGGYAEASRMLHGQGRTLAKVFLLNFLQRVSQLSVTMFCYLAITGRTENAGRLFAMQTFVVAGSNSIPIPGAMGAADYLMLDGFGSLMSKSDAVLLELLSRSLSFYACVLICGTVTLFSFLYVYRHRKEKSK